MNAPDMVDVEGYASNVLGLASTIETKIKTRATMKEHKEGKGSKWPGTTAVPTTSEQ